MSKKKVLIIDDSLTNLTIVSDILKENNIDTITLADGTKVEKTLNENKNISLILLDIVMPKIDGYTICRNLKNNENFKDIPVILLTALESNENKIKGFEAGAIDYITKPYNQKEVIARVNTHLELYTSRNLLNSKINKNNEKINELHQYIDEYIILSQTNLEGYITYVSKAFCNISGYSKEELLEKPHSIIRDSIMTKESFEDLWNTIKRGEIWQGEVKNRAKSGSIYWVYARVSPQKNENGDIIGYTSIRQDISQQKIAEELHKSVNNLLNNANEGFLSFKNDLLIQDGYSIQSLRILNQKELLNKNISEILFSNDLNKKELFEFGMKNIFLCEDEDTKKLLLTLLPKENNIDKTIFSIDYKILDLNNYMVILSDVTEKKQLEKKIVYENKIQKMIVVIATRKDEFLEIKESYQNFLENFDKNIDLNKKLDENLSYITKRIHTFKGLLAQEELVNSPIAIHELEDKLINIKESNNFSNEELLKIINASSLSKAFGKDLAFISNILGKDFLESNPTINIDLNNYNKIKQELINLTKNENIDKNQLNKIIDNLIHINQKSLKHMLEIYPKRIKNIAERLNKKIYDIKIKGDSSIQIPANFNPFIQSLVHVFRNMISHGIENIENREKLKKDYKGKIECSFFSENNENIILNIGDDGKGIDLNEIKQKALINNICDEKALEKMKDGDILNLIFHNNFSTKINTDLLSGRGVGLFIVKNELEKIGGEVFVESIKDKGTKFKFIIPLKNEIELLKIKSSLEEEFSNSIIKTTQDFIVKNIDLNILNTTLNKEFKIRKIYSVMKISLLNNVFIILSIDESLFNKFLSFFLNDFQDMNIDEVTISSTMDEFLNIIMGYAYSNFPEKYKNYELSTPLAMDMEILEKISINNLNYNYTLLTNFGNITISTLFTK